jgi:glyoxylase-like metal-dependent hydrolase (beta-lactamase superfamily II)
MSNSDHQAGPSNLEIGGLAGIVQIMPEPRIIRVPILPLGIVNAHLVVGSDGCVLVDAGLPGAERAIERVLARERLSFNDIKLIVITHAHVDHAGAAARVRELSGAPIVAHRGDLEHYRREAPMTFCPTGLSGRIFYRTKLALEPYAAFSPDILLADGDSFALEPYGLAGRIESTPGHTSGSISVTLSTRSALVGDLVASGIFIGGIARLGHARRPPFEDDPAAVARSLQGLLDAGIERFYMGHGGPLPAAEVRSHVRRLSSASISSPRLAAGQTADPEASVKYEGLR